MQYQERTLTHGPGGKILTNIGVWSPDGKWLVYDTRSDAAGSVFDGKTIEIVNADTGEIRVIYESRKGAHCGVATWHPLENKVIFILGPENPTAEWDYGMSRRQGVVVDIANPGVAVPLDARDLVPPFTPGALRGGSHVHVWSPDGKRVSFTYDDEYLSRIARGEHEGNQRNIGISIPRSVTVPRHPHNHDGSHFSVLVTRTHAKPRPGSDEISRACEEGWLGNHSLAFQGTVVGKNGESFAEVFLVELPADLTQPGDGPLQGTTTQQPRPPRGVQQRRLTHTESRKYPGIQGPRHWLRGSPDGSRIACLMRDDAGIVQFATVTPSDGKIRFVTNAKTGIESTISWHPSGNSIAAVVNGRVSVIDVTTGRIREVSNESPPDEAPRPEACVFSPKGDRIAFIRRVASKNQICLTTLG